MILIFQNRTPAPFLKKFLQAISCVPGVVYWKKGEQTTKVGLFDGISHVLLISEKIFSVPIFKQFIRAILRVRGVAYWNKGEQTAKKNSFDSVSFVLYIFTEKTPAPFQNNFYRLFSVSGGSLLKKRGANDKKEFIR